MRRSDKFGFSSEAVRVYCNSVLKSNVVVQTLCTLVRGCDVFNFALPIRAQIPQLLQKMGSDLKEVVIVHDDVVRGDQALTQRFSYVQQLLEACSDNLARFNVRLMTAVSPVTSPGESSPCAESLRTQFVTLPQMGIHGPESITLCSE